MNAEVEQLVRVVCADRDPPAGFVAEIGRCLRRTQEALPEVRVSVVSLGRRFRTVLELHPSSDWVRILESLDPAETMLVAGLVEGDDQALKMFEDELIPEIDRALRRFSLAPDQLTELRQEARVRILVRDPPKPARIHEFRGEGRLAAWVRTVTARLALNAQRDRKSHESVDELLVSLVAPSRVPPDAARQEEFRNILRAAFRALEKRDRTLLRMRYLEEMTSVALARAYGVHESTMSRWLLRAREELLGAFESQALCTLGDRDRATELLSVMDSQIDVSLQGLFVSDVASARTLR